MPSAWYRCPPRRSLRALNIPSSLHLGTGPGILRLYTRLFSRGRSSDCTTCCERTWRLSSSGFWGVPMGPNKDTGTYAQGSAIVLMIPDFWQELVICILGIFNASSRHAHSILRFLGRSTFLVLGDCSHYERSTILEIIPTFEHYSHFWK